MPVLTNRDHLVEELLENAPPAGVLRRLTRQVSTEMVLSGQVSKRALKSKLAAIGNTPNTFGLEMFLESLVLSNVVDGSEDRKIRSVKANTLQELLDSDAWQSALEHHHAAMKMSETREEFFGRSFGHLISASPRVVRIVDRYFAIKALKDEAVVQWLFTQLASRSCQKLSIWSKLEIDNSLNLQGSLTQLLAEKVKLIAELSVFKGSISIYLFDELLHDRYLNLQFSDGSISFELGTGIDMFKDDVASELEVAHLVAHSDFKRVTQSKKIRPANEWGFDVTERVELEFGLLEIFQASR